MQIEQQILEALQKDNALDFKNAKLSNKFFTKGVCPGCGERELFISVSAPHQLACSRTNNCGYTESTRARYSSLWSNLADKYPSTPEDPNATCKAYMSIVRGFPLIKTEQWFEQGSMKLLSGRYAETVRFNLWDGFWWDRLINERDIRENTKHGDKPLKADFKYGTTYKDKCWQPPGQIIEKGDFVYIVEGIFHAIAFHLLGHKVAAAFSCTNLPRELIKANTGKQVTWCLAYDAGNGGETASLKFLKEINDLKEAARITLPHSADIDWDDLYRSGELTAEYLEDCTWRGRLLSARSAQNKAFALYCWKPYHQTVITFRKETYSIKIDTSILLRELEGQPISFSQHGDLFNKCVAVKHIANCELSFLHIEKDKFTQERKYLFDVSMPAHRKPFLVAFTPANLGDSKSISNALLSQTDFGHFKGGAQELDWLTKRWSGQKISTVETVPFIGFDEGSRAYVFPGVGYQDGKCVKLNKHGFISLAKTSIKTTLQGVNFMHSEKFNPTIIHDFIKIFDLNGVAALGFWTASLFTRQIKERHQFFTFLEITGEKEAGKSTLIRFLWKMFGRENYEGIDILSTSVASSGRVLSQLSNLPLVLVESDREAATGKSGGRPGKSVDWDEFKKIFDLDGILMSRGVKTNDNQTNDSIFRGALVITQNASVQGSDAIISRITHLHCTTEHKRIENRHIADKLKAMDVSELAGYLHLALTHEKEYLEAFFTAFSKHRQRLTKTTDIKSQRVIDTHAQVMASVDALQVLFADMPNPVLEQTYSHIVKRAQDRERRLKADHPIVQQFWETYHFINDQVMRLIDDTGDNEFTNEKLNHSVDKKLIAINLNDFYEQCRKRGQELVAISDLKNLLPTGQHYRFQGNKMVRSRIDKKMVRCFVFAKPMEMAN